MAKKQAVVAEDPDDHLDGCDVEIAAADATPDDALPAAVGGVAIAGEGEEVDGCDVDIDDADATADEDLPAATGGVA